MLWPNGETADLENKCALADLHERRALFLLLLLCLFSQLSSLKLAS